MVIGNNWMEIGLLKGVTKQFYKASIRPSVVPLHVWRKESFKDVSRRAYKYRPWLSFFVSPNLSQIRFLGMVGFKTLMLVGLRIAGISCAKATSIIATLPKQILLPRISSLLESSSSTKRAKGSSRPNTSKNSSGSRVSVICDILLLKGIEPQ